MRFHKDILRIDEKGAVARITAFLEDQLHTRYKKAGAVVGLSGGVDSALTASLVAKILGRERVFGLILPERESNPLDEQYAALVAKKLGIRTERIDISNAVEGFGVYNGLSQVIRGIFPEYDPTYRFNITLPQNLLEKERFNIYTLHIRNDKKEGKEKRINAREFFAITSWINVKLRVRMTYLYLHAERNNFVVCGTTNKTELILGFFVKYGDGGVDIEPIAHLYKTQVYQLARYLDVPREIIDRTPTPGTWSLEVSDKDFYFCLPYELVDLLLYAREHEIPMDEVGMALNLDEAQVKRAYRDLEAKEKLSWHLREMPLVIVQ